MTVKQFFFRTLLVVAFPIAAIVAVTFRYVAMPTFGWVHEGLKDASAFWLWKTEQWADRVGRWKAERAQGRGRWGSGGSRG
jgi:hypothetical protein